MLFYEMLLRCGYDLRLVPVKTFKDGTRKGDVDARMAFEVMRYAQEFDEAIFLTGDGDYFWLFEYLLQSGKKIQLFGHRKRTARELRQLFGGSFADLSRLSQLLSLVEKEPR